MELPWLNLDQTIPKLLNQLQALAQTRLLPQQRNRLLNLYQPYLIQLTIELEGHLLDCALPLSDRDQETARLLLELDRQMIANYKQILIAPEFLDSSQSSPSERQVSLTRMLEWLARLARHSALIYSDPGEEFWRTVYRIYFFLEAQGWLPHSFEVGTISTLYTNLVRVLLFGACGPGRFRPWELMQIDQLINRFASQAKIHSQNTLGNWQARFFFDATTLKPPRPIKLLKEAGQLRNLRFLYPHQVTHRLLEHVSGTSEFLPRRQDKKLALRLAHLLGAPRQRRWRRFSEQKECLLIVGLSELIATLSEQGQIRGLRRLLSDSTFAATEVGQADFELLPQGDGLVQHDNLRSEVSIFHQLTDGQTKTDANQIWMRSLQSTQGNGRTKFLGQFADVGAGGYRLIWLDSTYTKLKVGEILGINHTQGEIEVGVIRWLRQESASKVAVGIELFSFAASPVVVSLWSSSNAAAHKRDFGLLLPVQPFLSRPACLLAPSCAWQRGQWVEIYQSPTEKQSYCLKQLIDSTSAYDLFKLEPIN